MRSKTVFLLASPLTALMLTACASSGVATLPERSVALPPAPSEFAVCFGRQVPAPPPGDISRKQAFALIRDLKASEAAKSACGRRLIAWYDQITEGFGAK